MTDNEEFKGPMNENIIKFLLAVIALALLGLVAMRVMSPSEGTGDGLPVVTEAQKTGLKEAGERLAKTQDALKAKQREAEKMQEDLNGFRAEVNVLKDAVASGDKAAQKKLDLLEKKAENQALELAAAKKDGERLQRERDAAMDRAANATQDIVNPSRKLSSNAETPDSKGTLVSNEESEDDNESDGSQNEVDDEMKGLLGVIGQILGGILNGFFPDFGSVSYREARDKVVNELGAGRVPTTKLIRELVENAGATAEKLAALRGYEDSLRFMKLPASMTAQARAQIAELKTELTADLGKEREGIRLVREFLILYPDRQKFEEGKDAEGKWENVQNYFNTSTAKKALTKILSDRVTDLGYRQLLQST